MQFDYAFGERETQPGAGILTTDLTVDLSDRLQSSAMRKADPSARLCFVPSSQLFMLYLIKIAAPIVEGSARIRYQAPGRSTLSPSLVTSPPADRDQRGRVAALRPSWKPPAPKIESQIAVQQTQ
jgi:hypothetical protein